MYKRQVLYNAGGGSGASVSLDFYTTNSNGGWPQAKIKGIDDGSYSNNLLFLTKTPGSGSNTPVERVRITSAGSVGIGITNPQYLLHVAGTIGAQQIVTTEVTVQSALADYVFGPDYSLEPLSEVKQYIAQHHHLPDIPSEAEVKEKGLGLGEMQTKLLAKIEELTLHMIQADERNHRLELSLIHI